MKKLFPLLLTAALLASLILPAQAVESTLDQRLASVTLKVKDTLSITDEYTSFSGSLTESQPVGQWNLNWSKDGETLQVRATDAGKILSYYLYSQQETAPSGGSLSKLPSMTQAEAKSIADVFLAKVLTPSAETVELSASSFHILRGNSVDSYYLSGKLKLYGIPSPIDVNVTVDTASRSVTAFSRSDSGEDYSSLTRPDKAISLKNASGTLFGTVKMNLTYALRGDGSDKTARLQYTPDSDKTYAVDAVTGKLVDITPRYGPYYASASGNGKMESASADSGLSQAEQTGVSQMEGALSKNELEARARAITALQLSSSYSLNSVYYYTEKNDDGSSSISAVLSFYQLNTDKASGGSSATVTLDAKSGDLLSLYAYRSSSDKETAQYTRAQAQDIALNFAQKYAADKMAVSTLADTADTENGDKSQSFTYQHTVNGIPFPQNAVYVTVDAVTGAVTSFSTSWDKDVTFASADGIVSAEAAKSAYTGALGVILSYVYQPDDDTAATGSSGTLLLAYSFPTDSTVYGIDAASGQPLRQEQSSADSLSYDDISDHYAQQQILALAQYGIGFSGGSFHPDAELTQKDALSLLVAAQSNYYYPSDSAEDVDTLYQAAYSMGILTPEERKPDQHITRAENVRLLLNAAGYGSFAQIPGIFLVRFQDAADIPAKLYGYVAVARGLGIVSGVPSGKFSPNRTATRAEAAIMLYNYMSK